MPRPTRAYIDHTPYHVITRGNQKQPIFRENLDFIKYLHITKRACRKYDVRLYGYCLMPNHVHLLAEPEKCINLSKWMHWINLGYTTYFNGKYNLVGHLWQGRFRSKPVLKDQYLIDCVTYIEANPIRAGLTDTMQEYAWSSYRERCFGAKKIYLNEMMIDDRPIADETDLILSWGTT